MQLLFFLFSNYFSKDFSFTNMASSGMFVCLFFIRILFVAHVTYVECVRAAVCVSTHDHFESWLNQARIILNLRIFGRQLNILNDILSLLFKFLYNHHFLKHFCVIFTCMHVGHASTWKVLATVWKVALIDQKR